MNSIALISRLCQITTLALSVAFYSGTAITDLWLSCSQRTGPISSIARWRKVMRKLCSKVCALMRDFCSTAADEPLVEAAQSITLDELVDNAAACQKSMSAFPLHRWSTQSLNEALVGSHAAICWVESQPVSRAAQKKVSASSSTYRASSLWCASCPCLPCSAQSRICFGFLRCD